MFWKIEERVTQAGFYIVWDGIYTTESAALAAIEKRKAQNARAVLYKRGRNGPERA